MDKSVMKFIGPPFEILIGIALVVYNRDGSVFRTAGYVIIAMGVVSLAVKLYLHRKK